MKGVALVKPNPSDLCGQTLDERIEIFLKTWLRQLYRAVEEGTVAIYCQNQRDPPPVIDYAVFPKVLALLHDLNKGVFKNDFGKKDLQQYIWCEPILGVQQASGGTILQTCVT